MNNFIYPVEKTVDIPYLPKNNLTRVIADERIDACFIKALEALGVEIIKLSKDFSLDEPICCHADMRICHLEKDLWLFDGSLLNTQNMLLRLNDCNEFSTGVKVYPYDIYCNCVNLPDFLICNSKYTNKHIVDFANRNNKTIIDVKQGYTKCSVVIVDKNAIITEDVGIYNKCKNFEIDCLLLKNKEVALHGYNCGFIGGSAFKFNKNTLMFCGNVSNHSQFSDIKSFCLNFGVDVVSLSTKQLYDYGTVIGLYESCADFGI